MEIGVTRLENRFSTHRHNSFRITTNGKGGNKIGRTTTVSGLLPQKNHETPKCGHGQGKFGPKHALIYFTLYCFGIGREKPIVKFCWTGFRAHNIYGQIIGIDLYSTIR